MPLWPVTIVDGTVLEVPTLSLEATLNDANFPAVSVPALLRRSAATASTHRRRIITGDTLLGPRAATTPTVIRRVD